MEFPFGRPSILSNFLVAEEVKKHVTVAYTGEGSDELFGGYNRYLDYSDNNSEMTIQKINNLPSGFFNNSDEKEKIFSSQVLSSFPDSAKTENAFKKIIDSNKDSELLNQVLLFELKTEIPGAQTWRIDRAGSAHALELREPFLDYNLVEFCASIPASLKINQNGETVSYTHLTLPTKA